MSTTDRVGFELGRERLRNKTRLQHSTLTLLARVKWEDAITP